MTKPVWPNLKPKKYSEIATPRNFRFERDLCAAIARRVLVKLRYDDDVVERTYAAYGVYRSTKDKVLLCGTQIDNPVESLYRFEPRNLEVGKIRSLSLTSNTFIPDRRFDPHEERYSKGFICRIN
jgi:hypothetical protein